MRLWTLEQTNLYMTGVEQKKLYLDPLPIDQIQCGRVSGDQ